MPTKIHNNVVDHRVIDNGRVVEDVTSIGLPEFKKKTSTISVAGMVMDVDIPNPNQLEAMEFSISHNNGQNCRYLADSGRHMIETRLARQVYSTAAGEMRHESVKYRVTGVHTGSEKGTVETGNPLGGTDKFAVLRYEEEIGGEIVVLVDAMAGIIRINGVDQTSEIERLLN